MKGYPICWRGYWLCRVRCCEVCRRTPNAPEDDRGLPDLDFSFYHTLVVFDHVAKTVTIISLADCRDVETVEQAEIAYQKTVSDLDVTRNKLPPKNRTVLHSGTQNTGLRKRKNNHSNSSPISLKTILKRLLENV